MVWAQCERHPDHTPTFSNQPAISFELNGPWTCPAVSVYCHWSPCGLGPEPGVGCSGAAAEFLLRRSARSTVHRDRQNQDTQEVERPICCKGTPFVQVAREDSFVAAPTRHTNQATPRRPGGVGGWGTHNSALGAHLLTTVWARSPHHFGNQAHGAASAAAPAEPKARQERVRAQQYSAAAATWQHQMGCDRAPLRVRGRLLSKTATNTLYM